MQFKNCISARRRKKEEEKMPPSTKGVCVGLFLKIDQVSVRFKKRT